MPVGTRLGSNRKGEPSAHELNRALCRSGSTTQHVQEQHEIASHIDDRLTATESHATSLDVTSTSYELQQDGLSLASSTTDRGDAEFGLPFPHFNGQCLNDPESRGAERVT